MSFHPGPDCDESTVVLRALAHEIRLKLMLTLRDRGEKSVGELEALTGIGQPGLSQQLAILRKAGLVGTRREAKLVHYSLAPETLRETAALLCSLARPSNTEKEAGTSLAASRARQSAAIFARIL